MNAAGDYIYGGDNPTSLVDPDGGIAIDIAFGTIGVFAIGIVTFGLANVIGAAVGGVVGIATSLAASYASGDFKNATKMGVAKIIGKALAKGALGAFKGFFSGGMSAIGDTIDGVLNVQAIRGKWGLGAKSGIASLGLVGTVLAAVQLALSTDPVTMGKNALTLVGGIAAGAIALGKMAMNAKAKHSQLKDAKRAAKAKVQRQNSERRRWVLANRTTAAKKSSNLRGLLAGRR